MHTRTRTICNQNGRNIAHVLILSRMLSILVELLNLVCIRANESEKANVQLQSNYVLFSISPVTKYIKIGVDDPNNSTEYLLLNRNQSLNHLATKAGGGGGQHQHFLDVGARNTSAIARLGESGSSEHILSPSSPASTSSSSNFQLKRKFCLFDYFECESD